MGCMVIADENLEDVRSQLKQLQDKYYDLVVEDQEAEALVVMRRIKFYKELLRAGIEHRPKF